MVKRKLALLVGLCLPLQVLACDFPAGFMYRLSLDPGNLVVGRDAPLGTVIYSSSPTYNWVRITPGSFNCPDVTSFEVSTPLRLEEGSAWVAPGEVLLHTRIPGVAVVAGASFGSLGNSEHWQFFPGGGRYGWGVPHREEVTPTRWSMPFIATVKYYYRLIKVGPIDPGMGPQSLAGHTLAEITSNRSGKVLEMEFSAGTLNVAQCGLPGAPSVQLKVPMGTWQVAQFKGQGSHTEARPFALPLKSCTGGTVPGNAPSAYLRLDPRNGSPLLDAQLGIIGLNADSDATGVGVQVLQPDQTPLRLAEELPIMVLANGDFEVPFAARYIQLGKAAPTAGVANASLSFTLTYK